MGIAVGFDEMAFYPDGLGNMGAGLSGMLMKSMYDD